MADTNSSTQQLIVEWKKAKDYVESCEKSLTSATNTLTEATRKLGKHLTPGDASPDEKFNIWANGDPFGYDGDVLLEVRVKSIMGNGDYHISVSRRKGNK